MARARSSFLLVLAALVPRAFCETLHVPSAAHPTIDAAMSAAGPGDEVRIKGGTYSEALIVENKNAVVVRGKGKVVIDASALGSGIIVSTSTGITLENIEVRSSFGIGVVVANSTDVALKKVRSIESGADGFGVAATTRLWMSQCRAQGSGDNGFEVEASRSCLRGCSALQSQSAGIRIDGTNIVVAQCKVAGAGVSGIVAITVSQDSDGLEITDNVISGATSFGIAMTGIGIGNSVSRNRITGSATGIELNMDGCVVADNRVTGASERAYRVVGSGTTLRGNRAKGGATGFLIFSATDCTLVGNSVKGASGFGYTVLDGPTVLVRNKAAKCKAGPIFVDTGVEVAAFENGFAIP